MDSSDGAKSWGSDGSTSDETAKTKTMGISSTSQETTMSECWGSDGTVGKSWGSDGTSGESWGSDGTGGESWGSSIGSMSNGNSWLSDGVSNLMGLGVGAGLVDGLFVCNFSSDWSNDGFLSENGLFSKNWGCGEGLGDDWSWLDGSDGSGLMNMGVFCNGDGLVRNLWCDFSKSFSSLYSVCKVSS